MGPIVLRPDQWDTLMLHEDRKKLAQYTPEGVRFWELDHGRETGSLRLPFESCTETLWTRDWARAACRATESLTFFDASKSEAWKTAVPLVEHVGWSADGRRFIWANDYGEVRLLDPSARKVLRTRPRTPGEGANLTRLRWSPDGKLVAVLDAAGTLQLWDVTTGAVRKTLPATLPDHDWSTAWSPDGSLLAVLEANELVVVDGRTGSPRKRIRIPPHGTAEAPPTASVAFRPDGKMVAAASAERLDLFDTTTGKPLSSLSLTGAPLDVELVFRPDGKRLAFTGSSGVAQLWDTTSPSSTALGACTELSFIDAGKYLRCQPDKQPVDSPRYEVYDGATGELVPSRRRDAGGPFWLEPGDTDGEALARAGDGLSVRMKATGKGASPTLFVTSRGAWEGPRDEARKLLLRRGASGEPASLSEEELTSLERRNLFADFVAGKPLTP
jgi:dipeptidyl aminopeptidase/acylaminoacyl peptidase